MKPTCFYLAAGLMCQAALPAQTQPGAAGFQPADSLVAGRGGRGVPGNSVPMPRAETGKPFSATATTQTTQTYLDGTRVNQTTTMVQYRDAEGRVRTETSQPGGASSGQAKVITIRDSVAGVSYKLDPDKKSAVKQTMPGIPVTVLRRSLRRDLEEIAQAASHNPNDIVEDLGTATVNGVPARGTRITTVVPVGAIGNDREFRSVSERWFSSDLNLLIKSINTDPRFGTTTYELTNISRLPPDPSLFRVPADYKPLPALAYNVIEGIEVRGMSRVPQDTMREAILSKVGDVYNEETVRRDFAALWKTNRFSDVQLKTEPGTRGGIIVRFIVTERP